MSAERRPIRVAVGRSTAEPASLPRSLFASPRSCQSPPTDIHEEAGGLILEVDIPGVGEADVVVQLEDNILSLQARTGPRGPEGARPLVEEAGPREFARSFILGDEVDAARITAELKDGVLRLTLPRAERVKRRRIEIQSR